MSFKKVRRDFLECAKPLLEEHGFKFFASRERFEKNMDYGVIQFSYIFSNYSPRYILMPIFSILIECVEEKTLPLRRDPPIAHIDDYSVQLRIPNTATSKEQYKYSSDVEPHIFFEEHIFQSVSSLLKKIVACENLSLLNIALNINNDPSPLVISTMLKLDLIALSLCVSGKVEARKLAQKYYDAMLDIHVDKMKFKDQIESLLSEN
jgi:hypothetical protein